MRLTLSKRDHLIIANALSLAPVAELGDRVGGDDAEIAKRLVELAAIFDAETAENMAIFVHQFKRGR